MADTVKNISIQGAALVDYQKSKGLIKRNARKTRKQQEGGFDVPPGPELKNLKSANITRIGAASSPMQKGGSTSSEPKVVVTTPGHMPNPQPSPSTLPALQASAEAAVKDTPATATPSPISTPTPMTTAAQIKTGGGVELAPSKKNRTRHGIVLAPPRESKKKHIRGHTRKIRVQLSNMKRRMQTAKLIHKQSSEKSLDEIRKLLEEAKLIKQGKTSVPEPLLRNMYRDYLVLRSKAL